MERALLMKGKVKEAYDLGDRLEFQFTDNISVFDKIIPSTIPFKGETLSREGAYWFERASRMGIKNHFLEYLPPAGMLCKKVEILPSAKITPNPETISFLWNGYAAGMWLALSSIVWKMECYLPGSGFSLRACRPIWRTVAPTLSGGLHQAEKTDRL